MPMIYVSASVNHGIIASKRCDHLLVKDNISYNNGGSGIMLHQSADDSIVTGERLFSRAHWWWLLCPGRLDVYDVLCDYYMWCVKRGYPSSTDICGFMYVVAIPPPFSHPPPFMSLSVAKGRG